MNKLYSHSQIDEVHPSIKVLNVLFSR